MQQIKQQSDMHEEGRVLAVQGGLAQVETVQTEACSHCVAKTSCQTMGGVKKRMIWAINEAKAKEGDRVLLALPRRGVLGAGFLVYMVPVLALILGSSLGKIYGPQWGWDEQNAAVLLGFASLTITWLILRKVSKALGRKKEFKVRLVQVLRPKDVAASCPAGADASDA
ncbi:SoxR reducing system RseC family protein [Dethiosulfatarculus sandiegensis]|nr:SoxR reducing system RseC family protein [Dethiosulfatarculus sandiegensis]